MNTKNVTPIPKIILVSVDIPLLLFWGSGDGCGELFFSLDLKKHSSEQNISFFPSRSVKIHFAWLSERSFSQTEHFLGGEVIPISIIIIFRRNYWRFLWRGIFLAVSIDTFEGAKNFPLTYKIRIFDRSTISTFFLVFVVVIMLSRLTMRTIFLF